MTRVPRPRALLPCLIALLPLAGCAPGPAPARTQLYALHTLVELTLLEPDPARARAAQTAVEASLRRSEDAFRAWDVGELARANAALAAGAGFDASVELSAALLDARALSAASGARFEPGVGRLVEAWGFHRDDRPTGPPPAAALLDRFAAARPGIDALVIEGRRLSSPRHDLWLDLGAYAKGRAVDAALAALRAAGARDALLAAAGDVCALGRAGARAWRIGVRDPRGGGVLGALELADGECVSTSGDYERGFAWDGVRYHHILDPATARPTAGLSSVTVIAPRGALADAAATAALVAGPERFAEVLAGMGIGAAFAVTSDGRRLATAPMRVRLELEGAAAEPAP